MRSTLSCNYDAILLTKTWLHDGIFDTELFDSRYTVFRRDRNYDALDCQRGGGVLIAISLPTQASVIPTPAVNSFEDIWIELRVGEVGIVIGCAYVPPGSPLESYQSFCNTCESLKNKFEHHKFLIFGDFNLPTIVWSMEDSTLVPGGLQTPTAETVIDSMFFLELEQINPVINTLGRTLDLVFADEFDSRVVRQCDDPLLGLDLHHPALELHLDLKYIPLLKNKNVTTLYQFHKADYLSLNLYYNQVDWSFITEQADMDMMVQHFYEVLFEGINQFVPKKTITGQKYPRWFDSQLRNLIAQKNKLHRKYKRSRRQDDYDEYSRLRKEVKFRTDWCYLMYVTNTEHLIPDNVKHFWSFVKSLNKCASGLPSTMRFNSLELSNPADIANAFASHFQSCYTDFSNMNLHGSGPVDFASTLSHHHFTVTELDDKLQHLDISKGAGPDGIPPVLLRNCCESLAEPLKNLFQVSMDKGSFPSTWKFSNLLPIFKSGDKSDVHNYRGISLLSAIPKLCESILTDEIFNAFKNYIITEQHGFYRGRSTATNLAEYQNFLISSIETGKQVDAVYTDLFKAFDSVCHPLLLRKLSDIGVSGNYLEWIESYLCDRRQRVIVCGSISREVLVTSGVPQGSHLGPILFLLFINDVLSCFHTSHVLLYADDLKLYGSVDSNLGGLQSDLDRFVEWCNLNYLKINVSKCKVVGFYKCLHPLRLEYSINSIAIDRVSSISDLGVVFDRELSFNLHIDNIILKSLRMLGFIKRTTKHINDTKALTCLYNSLVRSILEYCSVIWSPRYACHMARVEKVQNRFVKYLLFKFRVPYNDLSYETRLLLCGFKSLECRRRNALILFLYKLLHGLIDSTNIVNLISLLVPTRRTRHTQLFFENTHRTNYGLNAFVDRLVNNYNTHYSDYDIFHMSLNSIKIRLNK